MKKRITGRTLSRGRNQRRQLLKSLAREVVLRDRITTTEAKAKEMRPFVEKLVTRAKKGDLAARRHIARYFDKTAVDRLMGEVAPRYQSRAGGYLRIVKLGARKSDAAPMAMVEFVEGEAAPAPEPKTKEKVEKKEAAPAKK